MTDYKSEAEIDYEIEQERKREVEDAILVLKSHIVGDGYEDQQRKMKALIQNSSNIIFWAVFKAIFAGYLLTKGLDHFFK